MDIHQNTYDRGCRRIIKRLRYPITKRKQDMGKKHMLNFVDDKRHYVNGNNKQTSKNILPAMKISVSSWNELLHFVCGTLEISKYAWYLIK